MLREYSLAVSQKEGAFGITGEYNFLVEGFVWGNGGRLADVEKGSLATTVQSSKVLNGLAYLSTLINQDKTVYLPEELFEEENWGNVEFDAVRYFLEGNTAFLFCGGWAMPQKLLPKARFSYGMLPLPMGPDADSYVNPAYGGMVLSIPAGHKNVEKAGIVLNALMRPIQPGTNERLVQEEWFQEGDTRSMDCWRLCLDNVMFDLGYGVPSIVDYLQHSSARDILWGQTSVGTPDVDFSEDIQAVYSPKK
jgi:ABC-type glycerol-3-phosphate transport system substrate-binding protein